MVSAGLDNEDYTKPQLLDKKVYTKTVLCHLGLGTLQDVTNAPELCGERS